jgi:ABC-type transport system substrate-binding protein
MAGPGSWSRLLRSKSGRRRALGFAGGAAIAGTAAVALGLTYRVEGPPSEESLIAPPEDTSRQARPGGTYKGHTNSDIPTFDPHISSPPNWQAVQFSYSRLVQLKPGYLEQPSGELSGDLAESWELSPDRLQLTFRLRRDALIAPVAPVRARPVDAQDVLFSWRRFAALGTYRSTLSNAVDPDAPVVSVAAPDAWTVAVALKEPLAAAVTNFANAGSGHFYVMPQEGEGQFDPRRTAIGSGPFYVSDYTPSQRLAFRRNAGYYDRQWPKIAGIELASITEYAAGLGQLVAGNIYSYPVRAEDVFALKQSESRLVLQRTDPTASQIRALFGWLPNAASPFRDERVRQALSLSWDRDLWIDMAFNVSKLYDSGVPVETRWNSAVSADSIGRWWVDPRGRDFGPNARFYQFDLTEAKRLLAAAGYNDGVDVATHVLRTNEYGPNFSRHVEALLGFGDNAGFNFQIVPVDVATNTRYAASGGRFEGLGWSVGGAAGHVDPGERLYASFNSRGSLFGGFDAAGAGTHTGDLAMDEMTRNLRTEFDLDKRLSIAAEIQRLNARRVYLLNNPGGASGVCVSWPVVRNVGVYRRDAPANNLGNPTSVYYMWLDDTKSPVNRFA